MNNITMREVYRFGASVTSQNRPDGQTQFFTSFKAPELLYAISVT